MRTSRIGSVAISALFLLHGSVTAQDRGMAALQAASRRYALVTSLCSNFVQVLSVPLLKEEHRASGRLCQTRPDHFAMRFSDPAGGVFLVDGESVWYYMPSTDAKQAFRFPLDQDTGGRDFHREFLENPEAKYDVTYEAPEDLGGAPTDRLRLVPKVPASYRAAVLWIEQRTSILRQVRIEEENGNQRTLTLADIDFGATPPTGFFSFTPPPGVLVISR
jgi:outer membrane lipoprotein-sorting protein